MSYTRGKGLLDGKSYRDVIQCWETGQPASSGDATLVTNGESLYHVIASPWYVGKQARHGKKLVNVWTADTNEFLSDAIAAHVYDALRYADSEPVYPYTLQHVAL